MIVSIFPSTSESLPSTSTVTKSSSATVKLSFDATGASLTGVTVPLTVATAETVPSVIVYVNERRTVVVRRRREHQLAARPARPIRS